jgi:hypothetical protein
VASQIADGSKNSDIGRKLNHEEQIAKLRVKSSSRYDERDNTNLHGP